MSFRSLNPKKTRQRTEPPREPVEDYLEEFPAARTYQPVERPMPLDADQLQDTVEDYRNSSWVIFSQSENGWEERGVEVGRPYSFKLREIFGPGRYRCVPLDQDGHPVERLAVIEKVAASPTTPATPPTSAPPATPSMPFASDDLPPFVRLMLAQQAEERAEARRMAAQAEARREEWERQQAQREWERAERDERREQAKLEKEAEERKAAADRQDKLIAAGMGLAGTLMQSIATAMSAKPAAAPERGINEALLAAALRPQQAPQGGGIKDTLDMLLVLDQVAQQRADRSAPPPAPERDEDKDEGLMDTLKGILPMVMMMRGGSAGAAQQAQAALQQPGADAGAVAEHMVGQILKDPDALAHIASRDPDGTAQVFLAAVQRNPSLQAAVARAFSSASED